MMLFLVGHPFHTPAVNTSQGPHIHGSICGGKRVLSAAMSEALSELASLCCVLAGAYGSYAESDVKPVAGPLVGSNDVTSGASK